MSLTSLAFCYLSVTLMAMEISGLPVHILLLHLTVVLAPTMAIVALVYAFRPQSRRWLAWPLGVGAVVNAAGALLTAHFGEELERMMPRSDAIHKHAELGDATKALALVFMLLALALLLAVEKGLGRVTWLRWSDGLRELRWLRTLLAVLLAVAALGMLVVTILAGHTGASAAWSGWRHR